MIGGKVHEGVLWEACKAMPNTKCGGSLHRGAEASHKKREIGNKCGLGLGSWMKGYDPTQETKKLKLEGPKGMVSYSEHGRLEKILKNKVCITKRCDK